MAMISTVHMSHTEKARQKLDFIFFQIKRKDLIPLRKVRAEMKPGGEKEGIKTWRNDV